MEQQAAEDDARERPRGLREPAPASRRRAGILAALVVVATLAAIGFVLWQELQPPPALVAMTPALPHGGSTPPASAGTNAEAAERLPSAAPQALEPAAPLPALDKSDEVLQNLLSYLVGPGAFAKLFYPGELVHRFVVTVDNLPRRELPRRLVPMKPVEGVFVAGAGPTSTVISTANFDRYRPYVLAMEAIDTQQLVAGYVRFYPWFQAEYRTLGYPSGAFHGRLLAAIDDLLATPEVEEPLSLTQPKVLYQFADADLEALPAGQKILLRIGPHYAARIKAKLREIRRSLAQSAIGAEPAR